jgi:hypothetical protein
VNLLDSLDTLGNPSGELLFGVGTNGATQRCDCVLDGDFHFIGGRCWILPKRCQDILADVRVGRTTGVTVMRSMAPRTPRMLSAILTARSLARRLLTAPERVTIPSLVLTSTLLGNTPFSNISPRSTAAVMPWSVIAFGAVAACADLMSGIGSPARINSMVNQRLSGAWRGRTSRELFLWKRRVVESCGRSFDPEHLVRHVDVPSSVDLWVARPRVCDVRTAARRRLMHALGRK